MCIGFVGIPLTRCSCLLDFSTVQKAFPDVTYPNKICVPGFDMQIQKIENNAMGQIAKAAVIHHKSLSSINHLKV
jgi:hypothetical protein